MRNRELLDNVRTYVFKQVVKKRKTKISNVKYSKKSKKHSANVETDTENINSNKDYAEKTIALLKDAVNNIFKFK